MSELAKRLREHDEILRGPDMSLCGGPGTYGHSLDVMQRVRPLLADLVEAAEDAEAFIRVSYQSGQSVSPSLFLGVANVLRIQLDAIAQAMKEVE